MTEKQEAAEDVLGWNVRLRCLTCGKIFTQKQYEADETCGHRFWEETD